MKNIIFVAPPAAGKGTMSSLLKEKYGYEHISTGDLLREEKNKDTSLGHQLVAMLNSGKLVPDAIVSKLLYNRINDIDKDKNFILDGYPRNLAQAKDLDNFLNESKEDYAVIYLDDDYNEAAHRTLGRLVCSKCKSTFNKFKKATMPKVEGVCDYCGGALESRTDDTEETFKVRYQTYLNDTKPLLDYYTNKGKLRVVKSIDNLQEMLKNIENILEG